MDHVGRIHKKLPSSRYRCEDSISSDPSNWQPSALKEAAEAHRKELKIGHER